MINLVDKLSNKDKNLLNNYIHKWGVQEYFIGLDKWLENWNYAKQKLYKLLGNQFIYSEDFHYHKDEKEIESAIKRLVEKYKFPILFRQFIWDLKSSNKLTTILAEDIETFVSYSIVKDGKISCSAIKIKKSEKAKEFRLQPGTRTMRAISRFLKYYKEEVNQFNEKREVNLLEKFEEFRIAHSIIISETEIKGKLNISIHPLDFLTMSDNSSNWTSCLSWSDDGSYRVGTIEMLNSNNVLCCYITSNKEMTFNIEDKKSNKTKEGMTWNNKHWRQLFFITKDIIVNGKGYPFQNSELSKNILDKIKELAKKNLNWDYEFGVELYKDMKHINSVYTMERARTYAKYSPRKKNILFDTNGMYNDMIVDNLTEYYCYRNKVKKTKIINISGKTKCLCCGNNIIQPMGEEEYYEQYEDFQEYNDRYKYTEEVVCKECLDSFFTCKRCGIAYSSIDFKPLKYKDKQTTKIPVCNMCKNYTKICPDCGMPFFIDQSAKEQIYIWNNKNKKITYEDFLNCENFDEDIAFLRINCCNNCEKKKIIKKQLKLTNIATKVSYQKEPFYYQVYLLDVIDDIDKDNYSKYFYWNLENGF